MTRGRRPLTDAPERLTEAQRERILTWALSKWPDIAKKMPGHWSDCRDWHLTNGIQRADWEAAFRRWLRKGEEFARSDHSQSQRRDYPSGVTPLQGRRRRT